MEEQLITFKTAKLAKQKGFNIKTKIAYIFRHAEHQNPSYEANLTSNPLQCDISAPTQSLLQRWFREKHNIYLHVRYENGIFAVYGNLPYKLYVEAPFSSYEEALEAGLQEALFRI